MTTIGTLPPPNELERRSRVIAFLDTLIEPDRSLRYFDFDPKWAKGERLASMRSGEGDHYFIWFGRAGALVRGKHGRTTAVTDDRLFAELPRALFPARREPAFQLGGDSLAAWWTTGADAWSFAIDPKRGGAGQLLIALDGAAKTFASYAREYHELTLGARALVALFDGAPIRADLIASLSPALDANRAFAIAHKLGLATQGKPPARGRKPAPTIDDETVGDAEFKIIRLDDTTKLVVGGKVQLAAPSGALYIKVLEQVRATLRAGGASSR